MASHVGHFFHLVKPQTQQCMNRPFMIRFPYKGRGCYANVYVHEAQLREFHVHIIDPDLHPGLPHKIVLMQVDGRLRLAEPLDFPRTMLPLITEEIEKKHA